MGDIREMGEPSDPLITESDPSNHTDRERMAVTDSDERSPHANRNRVWALLLGLAVFAASIALALYAGTVNAAPPGMEGARAPAWLPLLGVAGVLALLTMLANRIAHNHTRSSTFQASIGHTSPDDRTGSAYRPATGSVYEPAGSLVDRTRFLSALRQHWKNCRNQSSFLALVQLTIDDFGLLCDEFGQNEFEMHLNAAERSLASLVESYGGLITRNPDQRQSGFLALFPNTTPDDALRITEDMCQSIEDLGIDLPGGMRGVMTASSGLCISVPSNDLRPRELFSSAARACDRARSLGRSRVEVRMVGNL